MSLENENVKLLYRINCWRFLEIYGVTFVITIGFVFVCLNCRGPIPFFINCVVAFFLLIGWLLPIVMTGAFIAATEQRLTQHIPIKGVGNWDFTWEEIDDWSFVEVAVVGGKAVYWDPRICLAVKGRVYDTNSWIVTRREAEVIAQILLTHCGAPKNIRDPVLPSTQFGIKQMWRYPKGWTYLEVESVKE